MATLLRGPGREGRDDRAHELAGWLDPLTLAMYQWRVASNAYDSREVLDALAGRLAAVLACEPYPGVEWRGPVG